MSWPSRSTRSGIAAGWLRRGHTLADAHATGQIGPNLDRGLKGRNQQFIRQSIVDPNAVITPGYPRNLMPGDFATSLSPPQIDGLVAYLAKVTR